MRRVVVLGRGGAGKSVFARRLAMVIDAPVVELDALFWRHPDLQPLSVPEWRRIQEAIVRQPRWVADGDLGPYDVLSVRLDAADTVVLLDYSLVRCLWRALRRSRERIDFWYWVLTYRRRWKPRILAEVHRYAPRAALHVLRRPRDADRLLQLSRGNEA